MRQASMTRILGTRVDSTGKARTANPVRRESEELVKAMLADTAFIAHCRLPASQRNPYDLHRHGQRKTKASKRTPKGTS